MSVFTHWQFSPLQAETIKIAHRQIPTLHAWRPEGHKELFLDKDSSDVTIIVYDESLLDKSKTFDCHKDIFSWQNEVFKALLTGNTTVESSSGEVQITDVPVEGMELLLRYVHVLQSCFQGENQQWPNDGS